MDIKDLFASIGCFVIGVIMFAIPILTTCAVIYKWNPALKTGLFLLCVLDFIALVGVMGSIMND